MKTSFTVYKTLLKLLLFMVIQCVLFCYEYNILRILIFFVIQCLKFRYLKRKRNRGMAENDRRQSRRYGRIWRWRHYLWHPSPTISQKIQTIPAFTIYSSCTWLRFLFNKSSNIIFFMILCCQFQRINWFQ